MSAHGSEARRLLRRLRRGRATLDFSDYLELRRLHDAGERGEELEHVMRHLEASLPIAFAAALPHLVTLAPGVAPLPRDLTPEAMRVMFAMREEFAGHGRARAGMMGFDLPEGRGLKDWLDFVETERKNAKLVREHLRELDRKIWAVMTGDRRMPQAPVPDSWRAAVATEGRAP